MTWTIEWLSWFPWCCIVTVSEKPTVILAQFENSELDEPTLAEGNFNPDQDDAHALRLAASR